jgi:hypothetical protein
MDASLFDEVVKAISALTVPSLGAFSQALGGTVVQSSPKPPPSSLLQQGFLLPSVPGVAPHFSPKDGAEGAPTLLGGCITPIAEKGVDFKLDGLIQSQMPIGFGSYGEVVVWDQGNEVWVGEDEDSPHPLGVCPPDIPLDWVLDGDEDEDPSFAILDAIEEDFQ